MQRTVTLVSVLALSSACFSDTGVKIDRGGEDDSSSSSAGEGDDGFTATSANPPPEEDSGSSGGAGTSDGSSTSSPSGESSSGGNGLPEGIFFAERCSEAYWVSSLTGGPGTEIQCADQPGPYGDVNVLEGAEVESGTVSEDAITMLLGDGSAPSMSGRWDDVPIESGAHLKVAVACGANTPDCDVLWQILVRLNGANPPLHLETAVEVDDQVATSVDIDLDEWAGLDLDIAFAIVANGWSPQDQLYFINPRVVVE